MVAKERDDDELMLFVEMREKEKPKMGPLQNSDASLGSNNAGVFSPLLDFVLAPPPREIAVHSFLSSENNVSDYEWLVAPPDAPPLPSMDKKSPMNQITVPNSRPTALKPRPVNIIEEPASKSRLVPKNITSLSRQNPFHARSERPSSIGVPKSSSAPAKPTSRSTLLAAVKPARSSTPTPRRALGSTASTKPGASTARSSTPTRSTSRSSTPNSRSTTPISKSTPMSATPSIQPVSPSASDILSSSSRKGVGPSTMSCPAPAQGLSPAIMSEMPGFSFDAPPNLLTSLPKRANSASRTQIVRSSVVQLGRNGRLKRQTCSPSRSRVSTSNSYNFRSSNRCMLENANSNSETPVLIGIKMVQRVVNMRKLASWKQDDKFSGQNSHPERLSLSINGPGFGRTLSKTSLEMAMRHMDIRQNMSLDLHASVAYNGRFGPKKGRTSGVSDSVITTISHAASGASVSNKDTIRVDRKGYERNDLGSKTVNYQSSQHAV